MVELIRANLAGVGVKAAASDREALDNLLPGRVLRATVTGSAPGGLTQLRLLGLTLLAESSVPLKPGQNLELMVLETKPQLVLAPAPEPTAQASPLPALLQEIARGRQRIAQNLAALLKPDLTAATAPGPKAAQIATRLQELVRQLLPQGNPEALRRALAELPGLSGLDLEARLAEMAQGQVGELPPSLRLLVAQLERELLPWLERMAGEDPAQAATMRQFLSAGQDLAEFFAANARLNAQILPQALFLLGLPLAWGNPPGQGELLLGLPDPARPEEEQETLRLVFYLELPALGPLAIEVLMRGTLLHGVFITDAADKAGFLEKLLPGLVGRLDALGYQAHLLSRARAGQEVAEASPLDQLIRRQGHYLSLKV